MPNDMILNDTIATMTAHSSVWRPPTAPRHRRPRTVRTPLTVALVTVLGIVAALALGYGAGMVTWYSAQNTR